MNIVSQNLFKVKKIKCKIAELCGLDMEIYFHKGSQLERPGDPTQGINPNRAATLLTLDPRIGVPEVAILGKAYVVIDQGSYPVSRGQVWGIQEIANDASEVYRASISASKTSNESSPPIYKGIRDIVRWSKQYREGKWGPSFAYKPRKPKPDWDDLDWDGGMDGSWSGLSDGIGGGGLYNRQDNGYPEMINSSSLSSSSSSVLNNSVTGGESVAIPICQYCHHDECTCRRCHMDNKQACEYCESRSKDNVCNKHQPRQQHLKHENPSKDECQFIDKIDLEALQATKKQEEELKRGKLGFFHRYFLCA